MRDRLKTLLEAITNDETTEAKWLNTLSMLEYIGARKIGRTMCREHPSAVVLDHWADETRHAYAFKRLCDVVSNGQCESYLARDEAVNYFQQLDERASHWVSQATGEDDPHQNYLLVTTLVERRAMMVYPLYRAATGNKVVSDELKAIIVEEQDHRVEIEERAVAYLDARGVDIEAAIALEEDLFGGLLAKMAAELGVELS